MYRLVAEQAITWANDDLVHWRINVSPGLNVLTASVTSVWTPSDQDCTGENVEHYMSVMTSQIIGLSTVCSGRQEMKHQSPCKGIFRREIKLVDIINTLDTKSDISLYTYT